MTNLSIVISVVALIIAFLSYLKAKDSFELSGKVSRENRSLEAERERTELLYMISDEKELVESLISDLECLKHVYDSEAQVAQTLLHRYALIFESHLPPLHDLIPKLDSDYNAVWNMEISNGPEGFLKLKAYQKDTSRYIRQAQKHTYACISEFNQRMIQAKEHQQGAPKNLSNA